MPRELGLPKYYDFKTLKAGTKVVEMGEYLGTVSGKFGDQHSFLQLKDGANVVIGGGSLDWRREKGDLEEGKVYDVTFAGLEKLTKGNFAGKNAKNFTFAVYDDDELAAAGIKRSGASAASAKEAASAEAPKPKDLEAPSTGVSSPTADVDVLE